MEMLHRHELNWTNPDVQISANCSAYDIEGFENLTFYEMWDEMRQPLAIIHSLGAPTSPFAPSPTARSALPPLKPLRSQTRPSQAKLDQQIAES